LNCIAHNHAFGPGVCPLSKYRVAVHTLIKSSHEALLRLFMIGGQYEGEQVKTMDIFCEQFAKVLTRGELARRVCRYPICV